MSLKISYLSTFLALTLSSHSWGQSSDIRGVVIDSLTGQRIPFANIVIVHSSKGTAANEVGFYLLANVPAGTHLVAVSAVGYERVVQEIMVQEGKVVDLHFRLKPISIEIEEIVVTAQSGKELKEIHTSVHILDQQDLKLAPVVAQADVFHSLKLLPGIVSTSDVSSKFYVRGGAGDQNLVLLDGMKIYNPFHALGVYSLFDPDIVRRVEIHTGAFPPGYGSRLSSVVNISAQDGRTDRFAGRASFTLLSSKLQLEGPAILGLSWLVNARKSISAHTFNQLLKQETPIYFYDVFVKVSGQTKGEMKYDVSYLVSGDQLSYGNPESPRYEWINKAGGLNISGLLASRLFVMATIYSSVFNAKRDPRSNTEVTPTSTSVKEVGVRAQATHYTDESDLYFFGFESSFPQLEFNLVNNVGNHLRLYNLAPELAAWLRYQTTNGDLQFDGGIHSELGSLFHGGMLRDVLQPRLSLSYLVVGDWRAKASYGRFSQNLITVSNEDDLISIFDAWIRVPEYLEYEHADHVIFGFDRTVAQGTSASLQVYYKYFGSIVTYNQAKVDAFDPDYVSGSGIAYGVEVLWRWKYFFVDLYATYAWGHSSVHNGNIKYYPRYDRRHHLNVLLVLTPLSKLEVTMRWEYGSGFPFTQSIGLLEKLKLGDNLREPYQHESGEPYIILGPKNAARLPAYHRLDVSAQYSLSAQPFRITVGVHVINVYDQPNVFYYDRKTGQQVNMLGFFPSLVTTIEF